MRTPHFSTPSESEKSEAPFKRAVAVDHALDSVLAAAAGGRLDRRVPISSNDDFGVMAHYTHHMNASLGERTALLQRTQDVTILSLASLAETRDNETGAHILRTQRYVCALAMQSAKDELGSNSFLRHAREIALTHHEKWDGSGYPAGLVGEAIPVSGRLMAVPDVYDALITKRVYKPAWWHERAAQTVREGAGSHFDPVVVAAFFAAEDEFRSIARQFSDAQYESAAQPQEALMT